MAVLYVRDSGQGDKVPAALAVSVSQADKDELPKRSRKFHERQTDRKS